MAAFDNLPRISVADDPNPAQFLKNAREAWNREHLVIKSRGGRGSKAKEALCILKEIDLDGKEKSQNQLTNDLVTRLKIHPDTATKYVKQSRLFRLVSNSALRKAARDVQKLSRDLLDLEETYAELRRNHAYVESNISSKKSGPIKTKLMVYKKAQIESTISHLREGIMKAKLCMESLSTISDLNTLLE